MKTIFLAILVFLVILVGYSSNFNKEVIEKSESKTLFFNNNSISEIENNDFILSTIEEKVDYNTVKGKFTLKVKSERSLPNRFNSSQTDKEITFLLSEDPSTTFSYYISYSKSIFLKGIIYTDTVILSKGVKVGMNRAEIGQIFNCVLDSGKNVFRIYDTDDLIEVVLNFNSSGKVFAIEINTSGYVS